MRFIAVVAVLAALVVGTRPAHAQAAGAKKPNILVI